MKRILTSLFCFIVFAMLSGCANKDESPNKTQAFFDRIFSKDTFKLYRKDITQGNILSYESIAKIKLGNTKEQVAHILGEPIMPALFQEERWDYIYYVDSLYDEDQFYRITLFFEGNRVIRLKRTKKPSST